MTRNPDTISWFDTPFGRISSSQLGCRRRPTLSEALEQVARAR
jgi:hypothetical protein